MTSATSTQASRDLARRLVGEHPLDAARVLERFGGRGASEVLGHHPIAQVAAVVGAMTDDIASDCLASLEPERAAEVLGLLDLDEAAILLRRMDHQNQARVLEALPARPREQMEKILAFAPGTAGSLMDPKVLSVPDTLTAGEALDKVRAVPRLALYYLYLVDRSSRLSGVVNLRELMLADPATPLQQFMVTDIQRLQADVDRLSILAHPGWTEYHALPVVDSDDRFVGAVRYETLRKLEGQSRAHSPSTALAVSLGELYWLGLSGILQGMGQVVSREVEGDAADAG